MVHGRSSCGGVTCLVDSVSVVHGRSSLMESLVWLTSFLCVKRREKREKEERKRREKMKEKMREKIIDEKEEAREKRRDEMKKRRDEKI